MVASKQIEFLALVMEKVVFSSGQRGEQAWRWLKMKQASNKVPGKGDQQRGCLLFKVVFLLRNYEASFVQGDERGGALIPREVGLSIVDFAGYRGLYPIPLQVGVWGKIFL